MKRTCATARFVAGGLAFAAVCIAAPNAASAQGSLELIPFVGSYLPLMNFGEAVRPASNTFAGSTSTYRQTIGVLAGAALRYNATPSFALEFSAAYLNSGWTEQVESDDPDAFNAGFSIPGNAVMLQGRVAYRPRRTNLQWIGGLGFVSRGGRAWDEDKWLRINDQTKYNKSNIECIVGIGTRASATARLSFDINAELHIASVDKVESGFVVFGLNPFEGKSFQTDLLVTVGVPIKLSGR